jgi:hypothetical protein
MPDLTNPQAETPVPLQTGVYRPEKPESTATIRAKADATEKIERTKGEMAERLYKAQLFAVVSMTLILGGILAWFFHPESAKDLWLLISPILSASLAILAGTTDNSKKNQ